jgi:hypothetical protein
LDCARLLSENDFANLLQQLDAKLNSLRKIATLVGVTRRTIYKYRYNETANIKEPHKFRLLEASLTYNRESTLRLLCTRLDALRAVVEHACEGNRVGDELGRMESSTRKYRADKKKARKYA